MQKEKIESALNNLSNRLLNLQKDFKDESEYRKEGAERITNRFYD